MYANTSDSFDALFRHSSLSIFTQGVHSEGQHQFLLVGQR